jgi:hypothetical protein
LEREEGEEDGITTFRSLGRISKISERKSLNNWNNSGIT